jgi:hypothetical protein
MAGLGLVNMHTQSAFNYFKNKPAQTNKCLEFMKWCGEDINRQQVKGGYIDLAHEEDIEVNYSKGLPSQRWHFLYSYCCRHKKMTDAVGNLLCPELIIWLCEASDISVTDEDINIMKQHILNNGRAGRNSAGNYLWNKYKEIVFKKVNEYGFR